MPSPMPISRRTVLAGIASSAMAAILAACGGAPNPTETPRAGVSTNGSAVGASATGTPTPVAAPTTGNTGRQPTGELRIAVASFPNTVDALKETNVLRFGMAETLMRLTPQYHLEPWLAERLVNIDPTTWRVTLRANAKFHDGSPVTAQDVVAAFQRAYAAYPGADGILSKETQITALDATTLEFKTPQPAGALPNALSSGYFIVHKPRTPGGSDGFVLTGPYRATKLTVDTALDLEAFTDHWAGPPPIARITIKKVVDPNAEALALQAGDTDFIYRVPPEVVQGLGGEIVVSSIPSALLDSVNLNLAHPPFDDRAVREATAWALDRNAFVQVALAGQGAPATGAFPPNLGGDVAPTQGTDRNRARQLLEDAGWKVGPDGVRAKEGKRLAFTLTSADPSQPELTAIAVIMQGQLKPLGYDVQIQQAQDSSPFIKSGNFDGLMQSNNALQTGDPLFQLNRTFGAGGATNTGGYHNPQVDDILGQLRVELDPTKRQALSRQVQAIVGKDVPDIFLVVVPLISAYRKGKVKNFTPHPDDTYLIDHTVSVS